MRKVSEKRFELAEDSNGLFSIFDNKDKENRPLIYGAKFGTDFIVDLLNSLWEENEQLRQQLKEKEEDERLYANEIVKLNKEVKDNQFLKLGNDY